jgi:DNA-binding beta-propeller fold protein YncE
MKNPSRSLTTLASLIALAITSIALLALPKPAAADYHVVRTLSIGGDGGWDYIKADGDDHRLYITRGTHMMVVDTDSGKVIGDITGLSGIHGVVFDHKSGRGFISNGGSASVTIFDLKTLQTIGTAPTDQGPDCICFDPSTERVFTFNGRASSSTAIDAKTGKVLATITLPGRPEFAMADGKGHIYDNIEDKSEVVSIDTKALKIDNTWPIAPGDGPSGLAVDGKNRRIFSVCDNQTMTVLDADSGKMVATLPIGSGPDACGFDPGTGMVFSPNGRDGTLSVYHEASPDKFDLVGTVTTQAGARTMALDEKTHHVFVVTAQFQAPPADATGQAGGGGGFRRRQIVPGSFVVIELAP